MCVLLTGGTGAAEGEEAGAPRYAWQMFTDPQVNVRYEATTADGATRPIEPERRLSAVWSRVEYGERVLFLLCRAVPDAATVTRHVATPSGRHLKSDSKNC